MPPLTPWGRQYETPSRAPRSKHEDAAQQNAQPCWDFHNIACTPLVRKPYKWATVALRRKTTASGNFAGRASKSRGAPLPIARQGRVTASTAPAIPVIRRQRHGSAHKQSFAAVAQIKAAIRAAFEMRSSEGQSQTGSDRAAPR